MKFAAVLVVACMAVPTWADIVHLKDGTSLDGEIKRTPDGYVVTSADGRVIPVPAENVQSLELKKTVAGAETAEQRLGSLRRSVANLTDAGQILQRFKAFIAQNPNTPAAQEAQKDVETWKERADKG